LSWRKAVGQSIAKNMFLKSTTTFDGIRKYVEEEIKVLQEDLKEYSGSAGELVVNPINSDTFEYLLPLVGGQEKGFQVHYNRDGGCVDIRSVDSIRGTRARVVPYVSIEPRYDGGVFQYLTEDGYTKDEDVIRPNDLDSVFSHTLD